VNGIDQALHGYRDGHRLLASSRELSAADRRRIAVQSDNADAGRSGDWEALLAGYPLPSGLYAWSLTWPAPEMPRPGCVWAHTLLVDPGELRGLRPKAILACFRRPRGEDDLGPYIRPVEPKDGGGPTRAPKGGAALLSALFWGLYEEPLRPVRVSATPWQDRERHGLMIGLWLQQWPALRTGFSLTDAPSTPRRVDEGTLYDLQLHRSARAQAREESERVLSGLPKAAPPRWASAAVAGLLGEKGIGEFLQAYGPEAGVNRSAFSGFCEIWEGAGEEGTTAAERTLHQICELFPSADSGQGLKGDLLDPDLSLVGCAREPSDRELLIGLLALEDVSALPVERLDLRSRVARIGGERGDGINEIVSSLGSDPNQVGVELLDLMSKGDPRQLRRWLGDSPEALRKLVTMRPSLAGMPGLWRAFEADTLWGAIASLRGKRKREEAVAAMLEGEAEVDPAMVIETWPETVEAVLDLVSAAPKRSSNSKWLAVVPSKSVVERVNTERTEMDPAARRAMLGALEPAALRLVALDIIETQLRDTKAAEFAAKVFIAAVLNASKRGWETLAVESFERLCGKGRGTPRALGPYLDEMAGHRLDPGDWKDRAARVLNLAFQENSWDPLETLALAQAPFMRLIEADKKAGLARRILDAGSRDPGRFKKWQQQALIQNVEERADKASLIGLLKRVLRWSLGG